MTLETRSFEIREFNEAERTVTGIAVPFNTPTNIGGYTEQFERGSIESVEGVKLFWNHTEVIGKVIAGRETDDGYEVTARISDTVLGRDTYTYLKDEVIDKFSVGFIPKEDRTDDNGVLVRTKVDLREVSLVPFPAYNGATISEVRTEEPNKTKEEVSADTDTENMTNENKYDDSEIRSGLSDLERKIEVIENREDSPRSAGSQFRSAGEFAAALNQGSEDAHAELRAYTGAVLADSHTSNDWKNDLLRVVDRGRPVLNLFSRGTLGPTGNFVEFPRVSGVTGDVALQAAEGDDLAYIELGVTTATAPVRTYGGFSELSRQADERSDVAYLDAVLRAQAVSYGKVTNAAVRTAVAAATPQTGSSFTLSSATASNFVGAVLDGVRKIDANGVLANTADFVWVSGDVFDKLATLVDTAGRPVFDINGDGSNTVGNLNVRGIAGSIAGIPVVLDTGLANKTLYVASSDAAMTFENPGAPIRLRDENIRNLTKQYALYGYMAVAVKDPNGLVKATIA